MSRLEKIVKTLDKITEAFTLITYIDNSVKESYDGDAIQTSQITTLTGCNTRRNSPEDGLQKQNFSY